MVITTTTYNQKGLVANTTSPHYDGQEHVSNTFTYDPLNRIISTNVDGLGSQTYSYTKLSGGGFEVTMVGLDGKTTKKRTDYRGRDFESEDDGGIIRYHYTVDGLVEKITLNGNEVNRIEYNPYGHQTKLIDVNSGTSFYEYNIVGQLMSQTDANSNEYNFEYDVLGNMLQRQAPDGVTLYEYYYGGAKHGLLKQVTGHNNISESFVYNNLGLLNNVEERIENKTYTSSYEYDQFGNNTKVIYPSGLQIKKQYDAEGNMTQVSNAQNNQRIWEIGSINANGQYTAYTTGNKSSTRKYNKYGIAQQFTTQGTQDLKFMFDDKTGNLLEREDVLKGLKETFEYDNLDRLTKFEVPGLTTIQMQYANSGNIDFKTDAGAYLYNDVKKNAVEHVVPSTGVNTISENEQNISYTTFNKVSEIEEGDFRLEFTYGPDQQRSKTVLYEQGQIKYTKYFSHLSEEIEVFGQNATSPMTIEYISGGHGLAAINVVQNNTSTIYFAYTDHLGTIVALTDASGNVVHEQNFDAWGRRRDVNTWEYITTPIATGEDFWWLRGYTGHEHLEEFALINMNGRLYDPILGRMLSPDNYVQAPEFSQSFNRYSYVFNNPLKYTDPTGNITWFDVVAGAAMVGGIVLIATGAGAGIGGALFITGISHFGHTIMQYQSGMSWNQASNWAGIQFSYTANFNHPQPSSYAPSGAYVASSSSTTSYGDYYDYKLMLYQQDLQQANFVFERNQEWRSQIEQERMYDINAFFNPTLLNVVDVVGYRNNLADGYNIDNAVNYLNEHAYPQYSKATCGNCARAVRLAVEAGGVNTDLRPSSFSAKDYGPYLEKWGFRPVNGSPERGDVRVMQNYPGGSPHGHMDMYNGERWVSDYMQNGLWPGPGYREHKPIYQIYRWGAYVK